MEAPKLTPAVFTGENKKSVAELIEEDRRRRRCNTTHTEE